MRKRLKFLRFSILLIIGLCGIGARADIVPATWGEAIQNDCYLNIKVDGPNVTLHQTVRMKLTKMLSDDYIYTYNTVSKLGKFNENSLTVITPPIGLKDSIFDHGCKLEYLSQIALEETLEVVFECEYEYPSENPYQNLGEILYKRSDGTSSWYGMIVDSNECIDIVCNQSIEVKKRRYSWSEWESVGEGKHIVYRPHRWWDDFALKIRIRDCEKTDTLREHTSFEVIPEHRQYVPNLIKNEFVTIEFRDRPDGMFHYRLSGTIELDLVTATLFDPFYVWFPNEETDAFVELVGRYEYFYWDTSVWFERTDTLEVKPSLYEGQDGFYILIPQLSDSSHWWEIWTCLKATLFIQIEGVRWANSSDFILVSAPQEFSRVEFKVPQRFSFGHCFSPFESEGTHYEDQFKVKQFYGRCPFTGIAHVEWDNSTSPEYFTLFQNSPNPFNQETIIRYSLPRDCGVKLSVYNLLGERVRILVDEPQIADDYEVRWDGKNEQGKDVASGVYFYKLDTGTLSERKKMVIIR
jgi:hypothetical protein